MRQAIMTSPGVIEFREIPIPDSMSLDQGALVEPAPTGAAMPFIILLLPVLAFCYLLAKLILKIPLVKKVL